MAFQFPWTNLHELNLDWFLSKFKQFTNNYLGTTATAQSVPYGTQPTVTVTGGELDDDTDIVDPFTFNFKIPAGEQGEQGVQGVPGQNGFSPIATVTKSGDTATITITDAIGTTTATVSDGVNPTNISWVEPGTTASRNYSVGDYFINSSGVLCMITATVANGGTLTNGTNYIAINGSGGLGALITAIESGFIKNVEVCTNCDSAIKTAYPSVSIYATTGTASNVPIQKAGILFVYDGLSNYHSQWYFGNATLGSAGGQMWYRHSSQSSWSGQSWKQFINNAELVTSISSASTNSQYPSAKCVYDLVGDIETILASI